ncbi:Hypothetical protein, putative [Bodo saltans]|uniref:Uncharacterized protein n=1 Tax=Bodo saltans TaxID=75058 RepID=A0A0S4IQX5_BODSA|nr:Hypothetical protein, putative [Bodo saltans]|eukprot:CUF32331.1 Hypothetical protein, putative [Bodo saltans]
MRCNSRCLLSQAVMTKGESKWTYRYVKPFVDTSHNPNMFTLNPLLLRPVERVFLDADVKRIKPTKPTMMWKVSHNLRDCIDRVLMEDLRLKYGAKKMKGFRIDPLTHNLQHPTTLGCSIDEFRGHVLDVHTLQHRGA